MSTSTSSLSTRTTVPWTSCCGFSSMVSLAIKAAVSIARTLRNSGAGLALRFAPVVAYAGVDLQRRVEGVGAAHLLADELADGADLALGHLEQKLVVHLEDEPRRSPFVAEAPVD